MAIESLISKPKQKCMLLLEGRTFWIIRLLFLSMCWLAQPSLMQLLCWQMVLPFCIKSMLPVKLNGKSWVKFQCHCWCLLSCASGLQLCCVVFVAECVRFIWWVHYWHCYLCHFFWLCLWSTISNGMEDMDSFESGFSTGAYDAATICMMCSLLELMTSPWKDLME